MGPQKDDLKACPTDLYHNLCVMSIFRMILNLKNIRIRAYNMKHKLIMPAKRMSTLRKVSKAYRNLSRQVKNSKIIFMFIKGALSLK